MKMNKTEKLIKDCLNIIKKNNGKTKKSSVCSFANCSQRQLGFFLSDHPEYRNLFYDENKFNIDKIKDDYYINTLSFLQDDSKTNEILNLINRKELF